MRIARFSADDEVGFGLVDTDSDSGEEFVARLSGHPLLGDIKLTGERARLSDVRLLSPVLPTKVVCIGKNYADHIEEMKGVTGEPGEEPVVFLKPSTSVSGPNDPIFYPELSERVDYEGELAIVISRPCREVPRERAKDVIFGYTVANDLTARDAQRTDLQWARAKGFDGACPLGPWIETELDVEAPVRITSAVDGEPAQDGTTDDMVFSVAELVSAASEAFTLLPGDVILTGTPSGVGLVREGQRVEVAVEGIGSFSTPFRR